MADVVAGIVGGVLSIIALGASFYLFVLFCHPQQKQIGVNLPAKIAAILGPAIAVLQLMIVPLDAGTVSQPNDYSGTIYALYSTIAALTFIFVAFINPLLSYLYEADEDQKNKTIWAIGYASLIVFIWSCFIFISYPFLSKYDNGYNLGLGLYMILCMGTFGWIILCIFCSAGIIYLPFDLLSIYFFGPKPMTAESARQKKSELTKRSAEIIDLGEKLKQKVQQMDKVKLGWFAKRKLKSSLQKQIAKFKSQVQLLQSQYAVFEEQIKVTDTPRIYFIGMLILGIICSVISLIWLVQLIVTSFGQNGAPLLYFMDGLLSSLNLRNLSFVATGIYAIMMLFLLCCLIKGYSKVSQVLPAILFRPFPLVPNKSYLNVILFNSTLALLGSMGLICFAAIDFNQYLSSSMIGQLFPLSNRTILPLFGVLIGRRVLIGVFTGSILIYLLLLVINQLWTRFYSKKK